MNWLDPTGASLSLLCTYYFTQAKRISWLIGMAAILLNSALYWQKGIYGHLLLEGIYFCSMIYGWYIWKNSDPKMIRPIRYLTKFQISYYGIAASVAILLTAQILQTCTDSEIPYWDAATTVLGFVAQWLLCLKIIHCWILWFVVDALVASIQFYKEIPFHGAVSGLYLIMAVAGFYRWRTLYTLQTEGIIFKTPVSSS